MEEKNMTAKVSCFARAYHSNNYQYKIFDDYLAKKMLSQEEYNDISYNMAKGIHFFNPNFNGTDEGALRWIVDNQLSPSVLGRSVFAEKSLENAIRIGSTQYLIFASGYDTFGYRTNNKLKIFELDTKEMLEDKQNRLKKSKIDNSSVNYIESNFINDNWINLLLASNYNKNEKTFCSLLGISYYLTKEQFSNLLRNISEIISDGSSIVFDYQTLEESEYNDKKQQLAKGAKEKMKSKYSQYDIEKIIKPLNLFVYEHLNYKKMTENHFYDYNTLNPNNKIIAPKGVNYCLLVKKDI